MCDCVRITSLTRCPFTAGDGITVSVGSLVPVQTGQSVTLPCWLDPPRSAEDLEIQWKRDDKADYLLLVYKERRIVYAGQNTPYEGRVSLGTRDAASGGLASGDVSLRLVNVTVEDAAHYKCFVSSNQDSDFSLVNLLVYSKYCDGRPVRSGPASSDLPLSPPLLPRNWKSCTSVSRVEG